MVGEEPLHGQFFAGFDRFFQSAPLAFGYGREGARQFGIVFDVFQSTQ
jgi:hypothetical protein